MIIFGVFGYLTQKFGFEGAPFLLGIILGPKLETAFRQSFLYGDPFIFFKRPISVVLIIASLFFLLIALFPKIAQKRKELETPQEEKL